ncbi:MAG: family 20 glycosylhydrolase [Bacteroidales bacterium]|nr:family 20 glycosylhydrolase [Bacteroidales bacterium]
MISTLLATLLAAFSIIPAPKTVQPAEGTFALSAATVVVAEAKDFTEVAEDFVQAVNRATGFSLSVQKSGSSKIVLSYDKKLPAEGYVLDVSKKAVKIKASDRSGAFYALQSFLQLLPADIYARTPVANVTWEAPCCRIEDAPAFPYRGMHLDVGRYYYPVETIKRFLDVMAMHKQNYLHWHLTEDQGWRIEIKKYPRLTSVGAWREETCGYGTKGDGKPHGGFYTQDEAREIVEYARRRCITVIPEIELPGHSGAAIAAYPWLSCTPDEPKKVVTSWGVKEDVYIPSPETFRFLEDVFTELFDIFPSPYYHIGGDECPRTAWQASEYCKGLAQGQGLASVDDLQYYFVKHFDTFLREHGKTVIGWDEILDGSAVQTTVVMSYRGHNPAAKAMERGMKTILCPNRYFYFDYNQDKVADEPKNHHLFITLRKLYNYDPAQFIPAETWAAGKDLLLGYQGCLWGEHIPASPRLETQTHPRAAAAAEVSWSPASTRNWEDFKLRMLKEFQRYDVLGVRYSKAYWDVLVNMNLESPYPREVELQLDYPYAQIRYTMDGTEPTSASPCYEKPFVVRKGDRLRACGYRADGIAVGEPIDRVF